MTELQGPLAPNRDEVAAKVIDGELIVIRLSDGTYYSTDNVGATAWSLIEAHRDLASIVRTIARWYGVPAERVASDVEGLVRELLAERLIVAAPAVAADGGDGDEPPAGLVAYEPPRLNVYRDMGNLLALDPPTPGIDDLLFKGGKGEKDR